MFLNPAWLCSTLGYLLAPPTHPNHIPSKNGEITKKFLQTNLHTCDSDSHYLSIVLKIIRNLDLGYVTSKNESSETYHFSAIVKNENDESSLWIKDEKYIQYVGRRLLTCEESDLLPPGFVAYLQAQVLFLQNGSNVSMFCRGFLLDYPNHQCLVKVEPDNKSVSLIGRICTIKEASKCLSTLDHAQLIVAKLCRIMCPAIFFQWSILNPTDLKTHATSLSSCPVSEAIAADKKQTSLINNKEQPAPPVEGVSILNTMFFGEHDLMLKGTGMNMKVAYLDNHLLDRMGDLLAEDGIQPVRKIIKKL